MFDSFPVCRTLFNHWIYDNPDYLKIWITMLGRARYSKETKKAMYQSVNYDLNYGQFIFGRIQWSKDLKIGEQKIRTCIKKMIADDMILLNRHTMNFTIYEIVNYAKYNHPDYLVAQGMQGEDNQRITNGKPTDNQRITTNEEGSKKEKKVKKDYISILDIDYVKLTQKQYDNIVSKYGKGNTDKKIDDLNTWKGAKGGVSKDDNLTLQNWIRRDADKKPMDKPSERGVTTAW